MNSTIRRIIIMVLIAMLSAGCTATTDAGEEVTAEPVETAAAVQEEDMNQQNGMIVEVNVNGTVFELVMEENETASAFMKLLPVTVTMEELNGNEKYIYLDRTLPSQSQAVGHIEAGDVMLYGDNCLVLFYQSFDTPYSYTRIGHLSETEGLSDALGEDDIEVNFGMRP